MEGFKNSKKTPIFLFSVAEIDCAAVDYKVSTIGKWVIGNTITTKLTDYRTSDWTAKTNRHRLNVPTTTDAALVERRIKERHK